MFIIYSLYHALGPATWCTDFPIANGKRQSPIDIVPGSVTFDAKLASAPLIINYKTESKLEASNTGKSIKVQANQQSGMYQRDTH